MAYVIAEPCIGTKDTACVDVCPVDCIHPRKDEAEFEGDTALHQSRRMHRLRRVRSRVSGDGDLCAGGFAGKMAELHGREFGVVREEVRIVFLWGFEKAPERQAGRFFVFTRR